MNMTTELSNGIDIKKFHALLKELYWRVVCNNDFSISFAS